MRFNVLRNMRKFVVGRFDGNSVNFVGLISRSASREYVSNTSVSHLCTAAKVEMFS